MSNRFSMLSRKRAIYLEQLLNNDSVRFSYPIKQIKVTTTLSAPYDIVVLLDKIKVATEISKVGEAFGKCLQESAQLVGMDDSFQIDYSPRTCKIGVKRHKDIDKKALVLAFGDLLKRNIAQEVEAVESPEKKSYLKAPSQPESPSYVPFTIDDIASSFEFKSPDMQKEYLNRREHFVSELNDLVKREPLQKLGYELLELTITNKGQVIGILEHEDDAEYNKEAIEAAINTVFKRYTSKINFTGNFRVVYLACKDLREYPTLGMLDFVRIKHTEKYPDSTIDSMAFLHAFKATVLDRLVSKNSAISSSYISRTPKS